MDLPTQQQCLDYFEEYKVPKNILAHCLKVQQASLFLARELNKKDENLNLEFIRSLAILHDLFKVVTIDLTVSNEFHLYKHSQEEINMWRKLRAKYAGMYESQVAYEVFKNTFPELALSLKNVGDPNKKDKSAEEQLVNYIDFRTLRNKMVSMQERLEYLRQVYPHVSHYEDEIKELLPYEAVLFTKLPFTVDQLNQKLEENVQ